ncbi:MAG: Methyltransferase FkbM family [Candidatus Nomurabacteria bacterium GW2011_GWB1_37_5]|uniref:Methyltransferase FkbM family n=1 Tax=Candidatus Nomurabacteria bacterium GW2011_GWB1_37_5 TaxID=1618742 RepID=A0A0G0H9E1_9BACT|nr:MAG: Methyltransferase FkbM family [Candidatus Nomurabacteria bacterium GW2011_GWB1_37_5]
MKIKKTQAIIVEENMANFLSTIPEILNGNSIKTIIELGARDCINSVLLHKKFKQSKIYTFECNPSTLKECRNRVKNIPNVELVEKAASNRNGVLTFYPIDQEKSDKTKWADGNPGASSVYKISKNYPDERLIQKEIQVPAIKLSTFISQKKITSIELLFMDIQGGELQALRGLEDSISKVRISFTGPFADMIFVNTKNKSHNAFLLKTRERFLEILYPQLAFHAYMIAKKFVFYKQLMKSLRFLYGILKR